MNAIALLILGSLAAGGNLLLDRPVVCPSDRDVLQYDDGTAYWLSWGGLYRGVFFDLGDFYGDPTGFWADSVEFWFYHHASYPWDTASFYAELYSGTEAAPGTLLSQESVTASHMSPSVGSYYPPIYLPVQFWVILNSEMSAGGWPSLLADNSPNFTGSPHSFYSEDFIVWEQMELGDYFIRVHGTPMLGLEQCTWGSLKTLWDAE